jgi:hypothetical protein
MDRVEVLVHAFAMRWNISQQTPVPLHGGVDRHPKEHHPRHLVPVARKVRILFRYRCDLMRKWSPRSRWKLFCALPSSEGVPHTRTSRRKAVGGPVGRSPAALDPLRRIRGGNGGRLHTPAAWLRGVEQLAVLGVGNHRERSRWGTLQYFTEYEFKHGACMCMHAVLAGAQQVQAGSRCAPRTGFETWTRRRGHGAQTT